MQYINRPNYIEKIIPFIDKPVVKILTGMRRVGKTTLLKIINEKILKDVKEKNKIYL